MFQARGDAVISIVADPQDPPLPMIADMVRGEWESGAYCVLGIKRTSEEHSLMFSMARKQVLLGMVERLIRRSRPSRITRGFGLY